ncbi:feruloyl esterase B precursor [Aspergillus avenaceus]|uniref:Carboxylic ester hydrolase n=1 Tax=Aspergillus avenaceus TaxID=36643 RepID=A0A5N6TGF4_ASPAV|nr:feruloyl esterase B precursor [Aspergillus avenaceus]
MLYNTLRFFTSVIALSFVTTVIAVPECSSSHISNPSIPGGHIIDLLASPVWSYQGNLSTIDFCNVTVIYTHTGHNESIVTTVWLPLANWNDRLLGAGGGGYAARPMDDVLSMAVSRNYTVVATDAGHISENATSSESWSLTPSGEVNMALLEDFASVSLADAATIGKQVIANFYGRRPRYSYWSGCSTGGRQGLMLAQRYPTAFDGIMAGAPAIYWPTVAVADYWPQFIMNQMQHYPPQCITDAITNATIQACDGHDKVLDGVISAPHLCRFNPLTLIGTKVNCSGESLEITQKDALVAIRSWQGPTTTHGSFAWYGMEKGTPLSMGIESQARTICTTPRNCTGAPFATATDWITRFVLQNVSADLTTLSHPEFDAMLAHSQQRYNSIIATDNTNLSAFKQAGGKMVTWQGQADQLIAPKGIERYYRQVQDNDPAIRDFYRLYAAPGVNHCGGGRGASPVTPLTAVVNWVEKGIAPDTLDAVSSEGSRRKLCLWPLVSVYKGGDVKDANSYRCQERYT